MMVESIDDVGDFSFVVSIDREGGGGEEEEDGDGPGDGGGGNNEFPIVRPVWSQNDVDRGSFEFRKVRKRAHSGFAIRQSFYGAHRFICFGTRANQILLRKLREILPGSYNYIYYNDFGLVLISRYL